MANLVELERSDSCSEEVELCNSEEKLTTWEIDRNSDLPDDVVSLILSFLTTKEAVATSILSKRWLFVWELTPDLGFLGWSSAETKSFSRFFWNRIKPLEKSFDVVRLRGKFDYHLGDLVRVITARNVRELDIGVFCRAPVEFRRSLLTSKTLVSLKVNMISFHVKLSVCLPRLRILHLQQIGAAGDDIRKFISGCPVLGDFFLGMHNRKKSLKLPLILFTSKTLVSLKLTHGISFHFPSPIHLSYLKILRLRTYKDVNGERLSQLLFGCPMLESMILEKYEGEPIELPYNLFTLNNLASLELFGKISCHVPFSVDLPCLKTFQLETDQAVNDELFRNLVSGCPLLEDMFFKNVRFEPVKLPHNLFISKTLVSLSLTGAIFFHLPPKVHLPRLKILSLASIATTHDEFLSDLLLGCPVLKELHIRELRRKWTQNVSICVPTLERLDIYLGASFPSGYEFDVIAPTLKYLCVSCRDFNGEMAWNLPNLVEAFVGLSYKTPRKLLSGVRNTKVLKLNHESRGHRRLLADVDLLAKFQNLGCLEISGAEILGRYLLEILENSDNLQKLTVDCNIYDTDVCWSPPQLIPHCLVHTLKAFSIKFLRGMNGEMQMVSYILMNARVLEKVTVRVCLFNEGQTPSIQEKLLVIPRCSRTSKLVFI